MTLRERASSILADLDARHLRRRLRTVEGPQTALVTVAGRPVLGLCSNNYLGLANHPTLVASAHASLDVDGVGAGASRLVSGTMTAHAEAEATLARFAGLEDSVLFSTGYAANVGTLSTLVGPGDLVFSDALNHASLIDGCRLSRAEIRVYRHRDLDHLEAELREHRGRAPNALIVTDAVFSMDGDEADLPALRALADRYDAALIVDEAHSVGVFGPAGAGLCAEQGVAPDVLIGALGKAFGASGSFVATSAPVADWLRNRARSFVFSTAPLPLAARVASAAAALVAASDDRRSRVLAHAARLRRELAALSFDVPAGRAPIVPVVVGPEDRTLALAAALLEHGAFVQAIRPPTVPRGTARLRLVPTAEHTEAQIGDALEAFASAQRALR